ncbi:PrsW family intramembrane metalloprotease [Nonomuraea sp. PA05]|uniref:PrsW family intramembrane metalloprotease n=1 Tax=Nonomuraea sp. PA05 TaxID=2604466 RepID=UPI0011D99C59|nr:PrsW family glutamic-type intramembrane protease [Nonomuraea sp. PA05]TYB57408.1 PrsW family intramembrane metalloprotease [Nonomuraea sp. PA05]
MTRQPHVHLLPACRRQRLALLVLLSLHALVALTMVLSQVRPPQIDVAEAGIPELTKVSNFLASLVYWQYLPGWALLAGLSGAAWGHLRYANSGRASPDRRERVARRYRRALVITLLSLPALKVQSILDLIVWPGAHTLAFLVCLPTTVYALWLVHCMQRFRRVPVPLLLTALGWGAVVAAGFGLTMNEWWRSFSTLHFPLPDNILDATRLKDIGLPMISGFFEELGKGAGVAILFLLYRRHFHSVVSGVVIGAATGLGFNFVESVTYMAAMDGSGAGFHFWARQVAGLMAAHTAFTAITGAAFGIARQLHSRPQQITTIALGFCTAAGAHFCNNAMLDYITKESHKWFTIGDTVNVLVLMPAQLLLFQGPLVVLYVLLVRRGLRSEAAGLRVALANLPDASRDAITEPEAAVLLSPARRFRLKVDALRAGANLRHGIAAYLRLARLHAAQLELATEHWHRLRGEADPSAPDEASSRARVQAIKAVLAGNGA